MGISHSLIGKIKKRISELKTTAEELLKLKDLELQAKFYPPRKAIRRVPDWNDVYEKSKKKKVSLALIYAELCCKEEVANGSPPMAYSTFCQNFDLWKKAHGILDSHNNIAREPGEQLQIDYSGKPIKWIDTNGKHHVSQVFVACLPASGLLFAYATSHQARTDWMDGVVATLEYIGGSPRCLVVDNAKALVSKADRYEAIFPMQIKSLCAYYKMTPDACNYQTVITRIKLSSRFFIKSRPRGKSDAAKTWVAKSSGLNLLPEEQSFYHTSVRIHGIKINDKVLKHRLNRGALEVIQSVDPFIIQSNPHRWSIVFSTSSVTTYNDVRIRIKCGG